MNNSTGIVRRIDPLGRIVIPKELRRKLRLVTNGAVEIFLNGTEIVFKKYTIGPFEEYGKAIAESIGEVTGFPTLVVDVYDFIAFKNMNKKKAGEYRKLILNKKLLNEEYYADALVLTFEESYEEKSQENGYIAIYSPDKPFSQQDKQYFNLVKNLFVQILRNEH